MADDDNRVLLVHPDLPGAEYLSHPDAVEGWKALGWKRGGVAVKSKKETTNG